MGSKLFFNTAEDFYILGLWLADGYWRSSSIGLTSVNTNLIQRFTNFLTRVDPNHTIKRRVYEVDGKSKRKQKAFQVYVNNRPLTRLFLATKTEKLYVPTKFIPAYLAGRVDGDGHIDTKYRCGIRIAYSNMNDAVRDQQLFGKTNVSLYKYTAARTYVLYLKKHYREYIIPKLSKYSVKFAP